jgi:hypothetical protein
VQRVGETKIHGDLWVKSLLQTAGGCGCFDNMLPTAAFIAVVVVMPLGHTQILTLMMTS